MYRADSPSVSPDKRTVWKCEQLEFSQKRVTCVEPILDLRTSWLKKSLQPHYGSGLFRYNKKQFNKLEMSGN